ncbi:hypothetical protein M405DRAFT_931967 [Rhizopogon salebrosus TDB-379]|nr:hypothetical protein M405DRAFT_931967 [Rhizopogon salebrosus TDB-379]
MLSAPGGMKAECSDYNATYALSWRRSLNDELNCNACRLYCKLHERPRPKSMRVSHGDDEPTATAITYGLDKKVNSEQCEWRGM